MRRSGNGSESETVCAVTSSSPLVPLTDATLTHALAALTARDPLLARLLIALGPPPLWAREPGFPTLLHIILISDF